MPEARYPSGLAIAFGVLSIILGLVAIASPAFVSLATATLFGVILLIGGVARFVLAFWFKGASNVLFAMLSGVLAVLVGALVVADPATAVVGLTLVLGIFFFGSGLAQIIAAWRMRERGGKSFIVTGIVTLLLGLIIILDWPISGLWVIGVFIGVELLMSGLREVAVAMAMKELESSESPPEGAA